MQTTNSEPLNVRLDDDGTATLSGRAVPYDTDATIGGSFTERFLPGSVNVEQLAGAPVLWNHDRSEVVGHIITARNEDDGAYVDAVIQPTSRGRDAITLLRSGSINGLSVGFEPITQTWTDDTVTRSSVRVREVSLATIPAYEDAKVLAVRKEQPVPETTTPEVTETREVAVDLTGVHDRIDQLEARMHTTSAAPRTLGVREAFELALADAARTRQTRALADVVSSGNAGVLPEQWTSEVRGYIDSMRYLMAAAGTAAFPSAGYSLTVPKITQRTLVAARGAEKSEVPSQALTTDSDTYTAAWYAGAVDVALELIMQSDPSILSIVSADLLGQYAVATEQAFVTASQTAATAGGAALDSATYGGLVADLVDASETIRAATGAPGDRLALTTASWKAVLGLVDSDDRRIFATGGTAAADGSASLVARSVNIGGVQAFHSPRSTVDLQFNQMSLRVAEKPPVQLSMDNVALMGRDIGVLGAIITLPLYPAGIIAYTA